MPKQYVYVIRRDQDGLYFKQPGGSKWTKGWTPDIFEARLYRRASDASNSLRTARLMDFGVSYSFEPLELVPRNF